jgi:hypothetical protein
MRTQRFVTQVISREEGEFEKRECGAVEECCLSLPGEMADLLGLEPAMNWNGFSAQIEYTSGGATIMRSRLCGCCCS